MRKIRFLIIIISVILVVCMHAEAGTYWISPNGTATWAGCNSTTPLLGAAACRIDRANSYATAGDTIYFREGSYSPGISPSKSGTAGAPIIFKNYNSENVTIVNTSYGINLVQDSYIVVEGFNFANVSTVFIIRENSSHNIIAYIRGTNVRDYGSYGEWIAAKIMKNSSYNWIHHAEIAGKASAAGSGGAILDIGDESNASDYTQYNLIENNIFYHAGHHVLGIMGSYNIIRNNYVHNEPWRNGYSARIIYFNGHLATSQRNLFDGNRIAYAAPSFEACGRPGMSLDTSFNIVRRNAFYHNDWSGINVYNLDYFDQAPTNNLIYHNTFFHNGFNNNQSCMNTYPYFASAISFSDDTAAGGNIIKNNEAKNNLYHAHSSPYGFHGVLEENQAFSNNWDGNTQGDPKFVNASVVFGDPMDSTMPDLHLQKTSPAIDSGGALTTITSPSGSGTSFQVANAGYFMDGWGIVEPDVVQLEGQVQRSTITNVDYASNTITVNETLNWTQDQGITLAFEGSAPDIGAYEFMQAGDTFLPSVSITIPANGTYVNGTIIIEAEAADDNNVSWVRFQIDSSVIGEDFTSPYGIEWNSSTVANGSHTITAIASDLAGNTNSSSVEIIVENLQYHRADSDYNGCVSNTELISFIDRWKINNLDVNIREIISALAEWKRGCQ